MKIFERKVGDFFSLPIKSIGAVLGVMGIYALLIGSFMGLIILPITCFIIFAHNGFIINLETKKYREYWGFFGLKFGKWKTLPAIKRITITNDTIVMRNSSYNTGLSTYSNDTKTALNLRINEREFFRIARGKYKSIMDDAIFLSDELNLEILDATGKEKKIIPPKNVVA